MASGDIKGFYRQKKSGTGKTSSSSKAPPKKSAKGSDSPQPSVLLSHGSLDLNGDYDKEEEVLRQFDLNMSYGPCLGLTRLERWERANNLGLKPPKEVEGLLKGGKVGSECLWEGRI